jgi:hypothetical protein
MGGVSARTTGCHEKEGDCLMRIGAIMGAEIQVLGVSSQQALAWGRVGVHLSLPLPHTQAILGPSSPVPRPPVVLESSQACLGLSPFHLCPS